jgi:hypothetical protein
MEPFEHEFIPSLLLPLPNRDFFAAGVLEEKDDDIQEKPLTGIFGPDAKLKLSLGRRTNKSRVSSAKQDNLQPSSEPFAQGGPVVLGSDGNIYLSRS